MQKILLSEHSYLTESILKCLASNGISTILDFLQEDTERLTVLTKLSFAQTLSIKSHIFNKYSAPVLNGTVLLRKSRDKRQIVTGITSLDIMLDGGIPAGCITEIYGLADSGKTQLCFQLAVNCARSFKNTVLYIDSKGDFSAVRVQKILAAYHLSHDEMAKIMNRIKIVNIWNMEDIVILLQNIKNKTISFEYLSLIIIDSLPCLMFQYLGDESKVGLVLLNKFVNYCKFLCNEMAVSVVCTNIQTRWVEQDVSDLEDDREPTSTAFRDVAYIEKLNRCLGNYWRQVPALLLLLEKMTSNETNDNKISVTSISSNTETRKSILKLNASGIYS